METHGAGSIFEGWNLLRGENLFGYQWDSEPCEWLASLLEAPSNRAIFSHSEDLSPQLCNNMAHPHIKYKIRMKNLKVYE